MRLGLSQQLMRLLCAVPPLDYQTIAEMLGRPIGSIGPTRARCLERLKKLLPAVSTPVAVLASGSANRTEKPDSWFDDCIHRL